MVYPTLNKTNETRYFLKNILAFSLVHWTKYSLISLFLLFFTLSLSQGELPNKTGIFPLNSSIKPNHSCELLLFLPAVDSNKKSFGVYINDFDDFAIEGKLTEAPQSLYRKIENCFTQKGNHKLLLVLSDKSKKPKQIFSADIEVLAYEFPDWLERILLVSLGSFITLITAFISSTYKNISDRTRQKNLLKQELLALLEELNDIAHTNVDDRKEKFKKLPKWFNKPRDDRWRNINYVKFKPVIKIMKEGHKEWINHYNGDNLIEMVKEAKSLLEGI